MRTILVSAYGCEPLKGSEQGVGWNWVLQMAKNNKLHVITRANNREPIENHLPREVEKNITFHYYDTNRFIRSVKNKAKGLYFYYFCWQLGIIPLILKLKKEISFDYSMHLTFGSIWLPTFLPLFDIPFIWGPIGGGEAIPKPFLSSLAWKQRIIQSFRYILKYLAYINPFVLLPAFKAVKILARTKNTRRFIPLMFRDKTEVVIETSMEEKVFQFMKKENETDHIRLIVTGRLVPSKNIIMLIKALKYIPNEYDFSLTIIGSGSQRSNIEHEIHRSGYKKNINIIAKVTREEVLEELSKSDIFVFPSLHEGGSWALMEAMAVGLPVICLKWSGMEVITDKDTAIQLPVSNPQKMPKDMANAVCKLIDNPSLRKKMGVAARKRIKEEFNWESKGLFMENLLDELDKKIN